MRKNIRKKSIEPLIARYAAQLREKALMESFERERELNAATDSMFDALGDIYDLIRPYMGRIIPEYFEPSGIRRLSCTINMVSCRLARFQLIFEVRSRAFFYIYEDLIYGSEKKQPIEDWGAAFFKLREEYPKRAKKALELREARKKIYRRWRRNLGSGE
jgi:hypothetical protein